jgi:DNA-binding MarR family transcriptional regulator
MAARTATSRDLANGLAQAMTRLRARLRLESAPTDMNWTWSQLLTLSRIAGHGPISASALAQAEHVRPQSMAETIAVLKRLDLVTASADPQDGRKVLISATTGGMALVASIPVLRDAWLEAAIESVTDAAERQALITAIAVMNRLADSDPAVAATS